MKNKILLFRKFLGGWNLIFFRNCRVVGIAILLIINSSIIYGQPTCGTPDPDPAIQSGIESGNCNGNLNFLNNHNADIVPSNGSENIIVKVNLIFLYKDDGTGNFDFNDAEQSLYVNSMLTDINNLMGNLPERSCNSCNTQPLHYTNPNIRFNFNIVKLNNTALWNHQNDQQPGVKNANNKSYLKNIHTIALTNSNYKLGIDIIFSVSKTNYDYYFINNGSNPPPFNSYDGNWYASYPTSDLNVQPLIHCPDMYIDWKRNVPPLGGWTGAIRQHHLRSIIHEIGHHLGLDHESCHLNIMTNANGETRDNFNGCQMRTSLRTLMALNIRNYVECTEVIDHNVIVNNDETWSKDLKLYGDLIISQGKTLTLTCRLEMQEKSKIIIEKGGHLVLDGALLTSCGSKWQGIIVEGNNSVQSGAGKVVMTNNAIIENAKNGISMNPSHIPWPALANAWGGLVEANNSIIRNCDRAVEFMQMDDDDSYFSGCTFTNLKDGVTLWDNNNVNFNGCTFSYIQNSAILAYDSRIVAAGNTITSTKDGIEVVSVTGTPYGSRISGNTINSTRDGVYAMAQTSASELQMEGNHIFSNASGITLEGMSIYRLSNNNMVGSQYASKFWATSSGQGYDYVNNNTFSSADWGNLANYENTPEFNDNCYGYNGKDLEVNSGSIYETQGDAGIAAGNCFSKGSTPAITVVNGIPFDYYIVPVKEPTCRTPQDYLNAIGYNVEPALDENTLNCTPPTNILYRKCIVPKTKAEGDLMIANILVQISLLEANTSINPELKKYLLNRYRACIKKIKQDIIIIILEDDGSIGKIQARKDAAAYAKSTGDLSLQTIGFGILLEGKLYLDAQQYLSSFPNNGGVDAIDFVQTQLINLDYIQNRGIYQLSESNRTGLLQLGNKTTPISGFARSLYYKLTGEKLPITFIHSERNVVPRSISEKQIKSNIVTYPNPVQGNVYHIDISDSYSNIIYQVKIYNLQGNEVQQLNIIGNGQHDVDISTINAGMYILSVESSGINVYNTKFVKI